MEGLSDIGSNQICDESGILWMGALICVTNGLLVRFPGSMTWFLYLLYPWSQIRVKTNTARRYFTVLIKQWKSAVAIHNSSIPYQDKHWDFQNFQWIERVLNLTDFLEVKDFWNFSNALKVIYCWRIWDFQKSIGEVNVFGTVLQAS